MASPAQSRSVHPRRIIVPPTPENQRIYNDIRQTHERMRLQTHVTSQQNLLPPSAAPSVSTSTIHSPIDEPGSPSTQDPATQDANQTKRPRGRRKGPLEASTRLRTALKRKLKLACPHHRAKKITCDCHDFSKLDENYDNSLLQRSPSRGRLHDQSDIAPLTPMERAINRETFGTGGGAAITPSDQDPVLLPDYIDLSSSISDQESVVRSSVQRVVSGFNTDSVHLDRDMLQAPGQTYYPGNDIGAQSPSGDIPDEYLEIGSQMRDFPNRWQCEYKGSADSMSDTSSEPCPWTGPFKDLSWHFRAEHRHFHDINPRIWLVCTVCHTKFRLPNSNPNDPESPLSSSRCTKESCSGSCQRWYYGSTKDESVVGSAIALSHSSESEAGFSWDRQLDGNPSWLAGGGSNGGHSPYYAGGSSYDRAYFYNAKWDTSSSSSGGASDCGRCPRDCLRFPARKDRAWWHPSGSGTKISHSLAQPKHSIYRCPMKLVSYAKLPIGHLLSIIIPLLTTIIREGGYLAETNPLRVCTIGWLSLVLLLVGFIATWTLKDRVRPQTADEPNNRVQGRHRPRNRFAPDEIFGRHGFGALITA
ncbi:hypothetical protein GGS26DRAFT_520267 [Hypomontagnella submonticulosa]|nr:hypothetical protein GGS26DRAFT_520267 [Hypomontagnella submonticulosa]